MERCTSEALRWPLACELRRATFATSLLAAITILVCFLRSSASTRGLRGGTALQLPPETLFAGLMGAAQSASKPASPYAWIRTPLTVVVMLMSQGLNWQSPALLMAVRGAFISMVGALLFFFYQIKGDVEARFEADQEYRERKVWIRRQKPKSWMSSLFGDDQGPQRPKADEVRRFRVDWVVFGSSGWRGAQRECFASVARSRASATSERV